MNTASSQKKPLPVIARLAVKQGLLTKDQLKHALSIQASEQKEGRETSLPEILAKTGMITPDQMLTLHKMATQSKEDPPSAEAFPKPVPDKPLGVQHDGDEGIFSIQVSDDAMTAEITLPEDRTSVTVQDIIAKAKAMGIVHGLARESSIQSKLLNANAESPIIIARGTPPDPGKTPRIDFRFETSHHRIDEPGLIVAQPVTTEPPNVQEGDLLAEKTPMVPPDSGLDIYGNTIPVPDIEDVILRHGNGCEIFEDQLKVYATISGVPFLSVEGTIHIFPIATFKRDYGVASGPVERLSCISTEETLTGEYPVGGGSVTAREIRNAQIDITGRVSAQIGITQSVIKAQGDIRARYIRGCTIETYGSVFVENEIMDSTIHCTGVCVCEKSKIVTTTVIAGGGVKAAGIGTATSEPCEITVGTPGHLHMVFSRMDRRIAQLRQRIKSMEETTERLGEEEKTVRKHINPLIGFHKKAEQAIRVTQANVDEYKQKKLRKRAIAEEKNLNDLKAKDKEALKSLHNFSKHLKEITEKISGIPEEIQKHSREMHLLLADRSAIASWAKTRTFRTRLDVTGAIHTGTVISGHLSNLTLERNYESITLREKITSQGDGEQGELVISKLPAAPKKADPPSGDQP
jgi:uncharacterized protein